MEWTELTPLSTTNLNGMEARIADADAAVITGKQNVYNAILAYGQTPTSQTFADLVAAINAIPIRGVVAATAQDVSGTTIRLRPPNGYYNGTASALVTATDPDFIAPNILSGKNVFGLTGTGKRRASGVATPGGPSFYDITVTGLDFQPSIIVWSSGSGSTKLFGLYNALDGSTSYISQVAALINSASNYQLKIYSTITPTGFQVRTLTDQPVYWWAFE